MCPGQARWLGRRWQLSALTHPTPVSPAVPARTTSVRWSAIRRAGAGASSGISRKWRRSETNILADDTGLALAVGALEPNQGAVSPTPAIVTYGAGLRGGSVEAGGRDTAAVFVVHGTKKFRDRVPGPPAAPLEVSSTALGAWYATVMFWKPQVALVVNESTLLPVVIPLAPAASVLNRFPDSLATVLTAAGVDEWFINSEVAAMTEHRVAKTNNRSVLGVMNEFVYLGGAYHSAGDGDDLVSLSLRLADTPVGPLFQSHVSPNRAMAAFVAKRRP
jgi:hypothetical protein